MKNRPSSGHIDTFWHNIDLPLKLHKAEKILTGIFLHCVKGLIFHFSNNRIWNSDPSFEFVAIIPPLTPRI